jgi:hypothetical protein
MKIVLNGLISIANDSSNSEATRVLAQALAQRQFDIMRTLFQPSETFSALGGLELGRPLAREADIFGYQAAN